MVKELSQLKNVIKKTSRFKIDKQVIAMASENCVFKN